MVDLSRLRITFLTSTLSQGGAEQQLFYIVSCLRYLGAHIEVLSFSRDGYWKAPLEGIGVVVRSIGETSSKAGRVSAMFHAVRGSKSDVFQSQDAHGSLYAALVSRLAGSRGIGAIRSDVTNEYNNLGHLKWAALRLPRLLAANSQAAIETAMQVGVPERRLHFLPNVVDTERFSPGQRKPNNSTRILGVGYLGASSRSQKRFDRFIRLLARLNELGEGQVEGIIAGDGPQRAQLEAQADRSGLSSAQLRFVGTVPNIERLYRDVDIFLLTSDWEGTPNVVMEAQASGLPVVATRVGGVPEVVVDGCTGFLVESGNEAGMVDALLNLVRDVPRRLEMGMKARELMVEQRSLKQLPVFLSELYERALS